MERMDREDRAEGAAISTRLGGGQPARGPGVLSDLAGRLAPLVERVAVLTNRANDIGDRAYGESPSVRHNDKEVREAPPYGGAAAELFYTIDRMEERISEAERAVSRIDGIA